MREFLILFKHELKMLFPMFNFKKKKLDIFGAICSLILTALLIVITIVLVSKIANGYVLIKVNKLLNQQQRATELMNILYCFIMIILSFACLKKTYSTLTIKKNKEIYLRLPIDSKILFLSKLASLLIWTLFLGISIILPINIIFYIVLKPSFIFWIKTLLVIILMPVIAFGITSLIIVPYIKIADFLKDKYSVLLLLLSSLVIGLFVLYSKFLNIVQIWLETGSIKFLFNNTFISTLQNLLKWTYPANCFTLFMIGNNIMWPSIIILFSTIVSLILTYFISSKLFRLTLYKFDKQFTVSKPKIKYHQSKPITALIKKEFICIYRNPKYLFSYIAISIAMPAMVYCCYTLFESLIINAFGLKISFSLALTVVLLFTVLTNTFCATNISRDGVSFLKMKSLAIKPGTILLSKVLLCGFISSLSILLSLIILATFTKLELYNIIICFVLALMFSYAQILIATKLDLKNVNFFSTVAENEATSNKTITKTVLIGLIFSLIIGLVSVVIFILAQNKTLQINTIYAYIIPFVMSIIYFAFSLVYYKRNLNKSFNSLNS